jgi:hypothetical protein
MGVLKAKVRHGWVPISTRGRGGPLPEAGATSQQLTKTSDADYDTGWAGGARNEYTAEAAKGWHEIGAYGEPGFQNGWTNYHSTWESAAFRMSPEGWVFFKGLIAGGVNAPVFTLPPAYRPWKNVFVPTMSNGQLAYLQIRPDGVLTYALMAGSNAWLSLSNARFPVWNKWSQFAGRYIPLEGHELRASYDEFTTGLWPQPNGMTRIMGISGGLAGGGVVCDLNNAGGHIMSYIFGVATNDTAGNRCFQISKRYGFYYNGPGPATSWTMFSSEFGTMACEDQWITPVMQNGWVGYGPNTGGWYTPPGYWKDNDGVVHLRGMIRGGSSAGAAMFTLPAGYRPPKIMMWFAGSDGTLPCRIDIQETGVVNCVAGFGTSWDSLDGINFYAGA